jgi:hypothetical protein
MILHEISRKVFRIIQVLSLAKARPTLRVLAQQLRIGVQIQVSPRTQIQIPRIALVLTILQQTPFEALNSYSWLRLLRVLLDWQVLAFRLRNPVTTVIARKADIRCHG